MYIFTRNTKTVVCTCEYNELTPKSGLQRATSS